MNFEVGDEVVVVSDLFFLGSALPKGNVARIETLIGPGLPFILLDDGWRVLEKHIILVSELSELEKLLYDIK